MSPETRADLRSLCLVYMQGQGKVRPLMQVGRGLGGSFSHVLFRH